MALAAVLSAGSVLPVFAYTANGAWSGDQHTTFGIQEGTQADFANQASFEVPLYVTMAAVSNADYEAGTPGKDFDPSKLVTPEGYDIKNSSTKGGSAIAIRTLDVEMYDTATWSIIENGQAPNGDKEMTFSIGTLNLKAQTKGTTHTYGIKGSGATTEFDAPGTFSGTDGGMKELTAGQYMSTGSTNVGKGITLQGNIKSAVRTKGDTVAQFRVVYHMVATDGKGNVKTAAAYVGDNKKEAGYK